MYPIYFLDNETCVKCGKKSIKCFDNKNNEISDYSRNGNTYYAKCTSCKAEYFLIWNTEDNTYRLSDKESNKNYFEKEFMEDFTKRDIDKYI